MALLVIEDFICRFRTHVHENLKLKLGSKLTNDREKIFLISDVSLHDKQMLHRHCFGWDQTVKLKPRARDLFRF